MLAIVVAISVGLSVYQVTKSKKKGALSAVGTWFLTSLAVAILMVSKY